MSTLALLGGGGHASDVLSVAEAIGTGAGRFRTIVVADDTWANRERFDGREVKLLDSIDEGARSGPYVISIGYPAGRRAVHQRVAAFPTTASEALVHPSSSIGVATALAPGVVVMGQTWLSAGVELSDHVHVGYGSTIGHDTTVGPFSAVMPNVAISGDVTIGDGVLVGTNATILQGLTIGDGAVIGAGAVVTSHVAPGLTVVGVPAEPLGADRTPE